jgi:hypothetical protein
VAKSAQPGPMLMAGDILQLTPAQTWRMWAGRGAYTPIPPVELDAAYDSRNKAQQRAGSPPLSLRTHLVIHVSS